ncbi:MFS transporter [uncultured Cohaesibacter sp.]|uniref:MFS transporter n=1 Tax=uncultured Cohaesibacter sp. TaxID=1002546 RepID=UPI0029319BA9|nr:MFS transporter [uncultured Cohaesibacter sp.]
MTEIVETSDAFSKDTSSNFGKLGWAIIVTQAALYWIGAGICAHGLNLVLPTLVDTYSLDNSQLLLWATPASWAGIAAGFLCAKMVQKFGPKTTILTCLLAAAIFWGCLGMASSITLFVILFAGVSFFGTGFAYIGGSALVANWFPRKKDLALGWTSFGQTLSSAFFVPLLALSIAILGVKLGFLVISALMLIMFLVVASLLADKPEQLGCFPDNNPNWKDSFGAEDDPDMQVQKLTVGRLLKMKDVWLMGLGSGCVYMVLVGVTSQLVPRLMSLGYDKNTSILYMSIAALIGTLGAYPWGWLGQKISTRLAIMVYMVWWFVAIMINILAHGNVYLLWVSLVMVGLSLGGATNLTTSIVASKFPRGQFAPAFGIIHPIQSLVRCCCFVVLAFGIEHLGGFDGAYGLLMGICIVTILMYWETNTDPIQS